MMGVCWQPTLTFPVGSIGTILPFVITVPDGVGSSVLLSNAASATVTWIGPGGVNRVLSNVGPPSAAFQWTVSAKDFPTARTEVGRCRVSTASGSVFYTSMFTVAVTAQF